MLRNSNFSILWVISFLFFSVGYTYAQPCPTMSGADYTFSPFNPNPSGCTELCPNELFTWSVNSGMDFENATSIDLFYSTIAGFNPALGQGTLIESIPIEPCPTPSGPVVINEFMHNPNAAHSDGDVTNTYTGEWVELAGTPGTDIGCYILTDGDWAVTIPPGTVIPPSGYFTIGYDIAWVADGVTFDLDLGGCSCYIAYDSGGNVDLNANFILTNSGEWLVLFDGNSVTFLDGIQFGTPSGGNTYPSGFLMTVAAATGVFPQVAGSGCVPSALNIFSFPASLPSVGFPFGNVDEYTFHRDLDYTGPIMQQNNIGGTLGSCNTPMPPAFPFVIDSSFDDTFCGQTLYVTGIVQTDCGMNNYAGQLTTEYEICIVCPTNSIAGMYCPDYSVNIGGITYDINNPTGTGTTPGQNGDCDTIVNVNLSFYPATMATLSAGGQSCPNMNFPMQVSFTGDGPYTFVYSINNISLPPVTTNNNPYTLNVAVSTFDLNVQLVSVMDVHGCSGTVIGDEFIQISPAPTISIGPDDNSCSGQNYTLPFTFTGTAPFTFTYTINNIPTTVTTSDNPYNITINPTFTSTYSITAFEDNNCVGTIINQTAIIGVFTTPQVTLNASTNNICSGDEVVFSISAVGTETYTVNYLVNNVPQTPIMFGDIGTTFTLNPTTNTTVLLTTITDGNMCTFPLTNTSIINVVSAPTATFVIDQDTICVSTADSINFYYVGMPPVTIYYNLDGIAQTPIVGNTTPFAVPVSSGGVYVLDSIVDANCSSIVDDTLNVVEISDIVVSNIMHVCDFSTGTYVLSFDLSGGTGDYFVDGNSIGNTFTSMPIVSNMNYSFLVSDGSGCSDYEVMGTFNCDCPNFSGIMSPDTLHLCLGDDLIYAPATGYLLTPTDTIVYIIHDLAGTTLGIISYTDYSNFVVDNASLPPLTEVVYYISAVTGPALADGTIDLSDPCLLVSAGTPFIVHNIPDFILTDDWTVCSNDSVIFNIASTGNTPFSFSYNFANTDYPVITNNTSYDITQAHLFDQLLIVHNFSDAYCSTDKIDTVEYNVIPTISYLNLSADCDFGAGTFTVSFDLLGGQGTYYVDGVALTTNSFISNDFVANTNYDFAIWSDAQCDTIHILGLQSCDCPNDSGEMSQDTLHICQGEDLAFDLATNYTLGTNDTIEYVVHDLPGNTLGTAYVFNNQSPMPAFTLEALDLETVYYVSSVTGLDTGTGAVDLTDDCAMIAPGTPFIIHSLPTVNFDSQVVICENDCLMIPLAFVGAPPFDYSYTLNNVLINGNTNTLEDSIMVCANDYLPTISATTLTFNSLTNDYCPALIPMPAIDILFEEIQYSNQGGALCQGDTVIINGVLFDENNLIYIDTSYNISGCINEITSITLDLVLPSMATFQDTYCENDTIIIGGQSFFSGHTTDTILLDNMNSVGCDSSIMVDLAFLPIINVRITGDTALCDIDLAPVLLQLPLGVMGDITFLVNNVPMVFNNVSNGFSFDIMLSEDTEVSIASFITTTPNCGITNDAVVTLNFGDVGLDIFSNVDYGGYDVSCNGGDGQIASLVTNGSTPISYLWSNMSQDSTLENVDAGEWSLKVEDADGCQAFDTIILSQAPALGIFLQAIDPLCFGDASGYIVIDSVTGSNGPFFYQLTGQSEVAITQFPTIIPSVASGEYEVAIRDTSGCQYLESVELVDPIQPFLQIVGSDEIPLGDSTLLTTQYSFGLDTFFWNPVNTLSCDTCLTTFATPINTTTYHLTAIDTNGCITTQYLTVVVTVDRSVFIPTVFTPNGDGTNDYLFIQGSQDIEEIVSYSIFSRWGERLYILEHFQPNVYGNGWDGYFHGQPMGQGVFMYQAEVLFKDGETLRFEGDVTLIR